MAQMDFQIQSDLPRALAWTRQLTREMRISIADSMTAGARAAERAIKAQAPRRLNNPTGWTINSTFVKPANARNLSVAFGFKDYAVKGTPAAKYLQPLASGNPRGSKGFERVLQRSGILRSNQYAIPTGVTPLKLNSFGNLTGGQYTQVLSRLKALGEQGYSANVSAQTRSQRKRSQADYFTGRPGGAQGHIYARVGSKPKGNPGGIGRPMTIGLKRGFHTVFSITTKQPRYQLQFDTEKVLAKTFENVYQSTLARLLGSA